MPGRVEDFSPPWCQTILNDPEWKCVAVGWEADGRPSTVLNEFWGTTLSTADGLRAVQGMVRSKANSAANSEPDVQMLLSLGADLAGASGILHGGFTATTLDMISGFCVNVLARWTFITTAMLKVDYKIPCPVPSVAICKAWLTKTEGKKYFLRATLEDGCGKVYATADVMYIKLKTQL